MSDKLKTPSIRDVSRSAGVSATTVSRVLNNSSIPSTATRERVLAAIKKLGYRPDSLFSMAVKRDRLGLRGKPVSTGTIAYLANMQYFNRARRDDGYYSAVAQGIQTVLRSQPHHLLLEDIEWGQQTLPRCVEDGKVDGLLVEGTIDETLRNLLVQRVTTVFIDRMYSELPCSCIVPNFAQAITSQMEYLWELGHRNIAIFWHDVGDYQQQVSLEAFHSIFAKNKTPLAHPQLCKPRELNPKINNQVFQTYAQEIASARPRPTALIGPNAYVMPIMVRLQQLKLRVPQDISVIGTNDQVDGNLINPPLTSWQMAMGEVGRCATEILLQEIQDSSRPHRRILVDGYRIERSSCAPPPPHP